LPLIRDVVLVVLAVAVVTDRGEVVGDEDDATFTDGEATVGAAVGGIGAGLFFLRVTGFGLSSSTSPFSCAGRLHVMKKSISVQSDQSFLLILF